MPSNLTPSEVLTPKQWRAVESLLATGEVAAAAKEVNVSRDTLHRWMKQQPFAQAVRDAEARALDDLSRLLVRMGRTAAATLQQQIARIEDLIDGERLAEVDAHRAAREVIADERRMRRSA